MTAELLLQHFSRAVDDVEAIPPLRRFILDLAVRGKLVPQDPNDEPASELLKRIEKEKTRLIRNGEIKESDLLKVSLNDIGPYEIPNSWCWVSVGTTVNQHLGGGTPSKNNPRYWDGDIFWASVKDVGKDKYISETIDRITDEGLNNSSSNVIPPENLILVTRMGLGKLSINRVPLAINQDLRALMLSRLCQIDYHYIFFKTHSFEGSGLTVKGIKIEDLLTTPFPLPPLAEQHRIVAKVDELMALCDELEAAQNQRESKRDRLVTAALNALTNPDAAPDILIRNSKFVIRNFSPLIARAKHITQLRNAILNLAVQGKLVPQDHNDEPASELLKRIEKEKARLAKEGKIKKIDGYLLEDKSVPLCELPKNWEMASLQTLCISVTDGDHLPPPKAETGIPFLVIGNVRWNAIDFSDCRYVTEDYYSALDPIRKPMNGDILYTLVGSFGIPVPVLDNRPFCVQRHIGILRSSKLLNTRYLVRALESKFIYDQAERCATGIAQKTVPLSGLRKIQVPIPPLCEQDRIAHKVDEIMTLCDNLETQLTNTAFTQCQFLEAMLQKALLNG